MIDCGEGTQMQLRRNKLKFSNLCHIFITHLHGDHCFGLLGLISTLALLGRTKTLHVWGPIGLVRIFQPQIDFFCEGMSYQVELHEVDASSASVIFEDRSLVVETIPLHHKVSCCGYLIREKQLLRHIRRDAIDAYHIPVCYINNIKAGADFTLPDGEVVPNHLLTTPADPVRSYAYCSDTMPVPSNAKQLQEVTMLYHEATFCHVDSLLARKTFHSTTVQAAEFAKQCNARRLLIGHFSSRYTDEKILLDEVRAIFPAAELAAENLRIQL